MILNKFTISVATLITVILVCFKIANVGSVSWLVALSPIPILLAIFLLFVVVAGFLIFVGVLFGAWNDKSKVKKKVAK